MVIEIGLQCPACGRVYSAEMDDYKPVDRGTAKAVVIHCMKCKNHPVLNLITQYELRNLKEVKEFPTRSRILKPQMVVVR
jgi:hypothetical protein